MLIINFLLYMRYHFVLKIKQFFLLHTKPHNIFNYFQRTAYSELVMFWYYTLETKNSTHVIKKLKIAYPGYRFGEECICCTMWDKWQIIVGRSNYYWIHKRWYIYVVKDFML